MSLNPPITNHAPLASAQPWCARRAPFLKWRHPGATLVMGVVSSNAGLEDSATRASPDGFPRTEALIRCHILEQSLSVRLCRTLPGVPQYDRWLRHLHANDAINIFFFLGRDFILLSLVVDWLYLGSLLLSFFVIIPSIHLRHLAPPDF